MHICIYPIFILSNIAKKYLTVRVKVKKKCVQDIYLIYNQLKI